MTIAELSHPNKEKNLKNALKVLINICKNGKVSDPNVDICKTTSLPTLSLNLFRAYVRSDQLEQLQDVGIELLHANTELGKLFFNKTQGIDPLFSRNIVPVFTQIFR